jgi:hypothetical protein
MKKTLTSILMVIMVLTAGAQSLKSNNTALSFKLPMTNEFGFASYDRKISTNLMLLTGMEADASDKTAANEKKKASLAGEYLGFFGKAMKYEKVTPELLVEFTTSDFVVSSTVEDVAAAKDEDVVAKIEGSGVLRYVNTKTGAEVFRKEFSIPAEEASITKAKIAKLDPGLTMRIKFTKKSDTKAIAAQYTEAFEAAKLNYFYGLLKKASGYAKANFEDQKGMTQLPLYFAKGKADYAELEKTSEAFKAALKGLKAETTISALKASPAYETIKNSIAVWEKEISTAGTDENARISAEIASGLQLNLATAYILIGEFEKAEQALINSGFVVATGTELSNTGSPKEYFMHLRKLLNTAMPGAERVVFYN